MEEFRTNEGEFGKRARNTELSVLKFSLHFMNNLA